MYRGSSQAMAKAVEKLNSNELKVEDILEDDDLVSDIKTGPTCQISNL
jgi:hypothetical protein